MPKPEAILKPNTEQLLKQEYHSEGQFKVDGENYIMINSVIRLHLTLLC